MELVVKLPKFEGFDNIYLIPSTDFSQVRTIFSTIITKWIFCTIMHYVLSICQLLLLKIFKNGFISHLFFYITLTMMYYILIRMDLTTAFSTIRTLLQFWMDPSAYLTSKGSCIVPLILSIRRIVLKWSATEEW